MMDVFSNLEQVLDDDYRHPIPMGIPGIDKLLKVVWQKVKLVLSWLQRVLVKQPILTKIANHAFNLGFNVLQIFFEDNPKYPKKTLHLVD